MTAATPTPLILEIKGNSLDDGPGIRSVVFFKGCPLSCVWCHNPESKKPGPELAYDPKLCLACFLCQTICPEQAVSPDYPGFIDRGRCTLCFACAEHCPGGALSRVGRAMTAEAVLEKVAADKPFFDASNGGVTLSGGEPTLFMEYAAGLLAAFRARQIHTLLETCGFFDFDRFMDLMYPRLDAIYFDLKLFDNAAHRRYCGVPNEKILTNFEKLVKVTTADNKPLLPRTPLIPGITDGQDNLKAIAGFLKGLGVTRAALLAYNPLWHEKTGKIGGQNLLGDDPAMKKFLSAEAVAQCQAIFYNEGIEV
jgi:pyruvate formate lyase activating enzyme